LLTLPEFLPARWLRGPHAQTILPSLLPAAGVNGKCDAIDVPVAPATRVRMLLSTPDRTPRGTLLVVHGLGGSAESGYMRRTAACALARGWVVARLNLRNCGGTEPLAATLYNAGQSDDADAALSALDARGFSRPFALVGFSLGGNIVMRYAGLSGGACRADAVVGVNPPVDLSVCIDAIERPANAIYHAYFTRGLCGQLARIRKLRQVPGPKAVPRAIGGVRGFDDAFTAPDAGYASAADYYRGASAAPTLSGVRRPSLILSAEDDPFVPVSMFEAHRHASAQLTLSHPRAGGHCGYWAARHPRFWAAEAALAFIEASALRG
jgi:predicted alpha/beta-fold hydrolase